MGATIPQQFSDAFQQNRFGVATGTVAAVQFPSNPCGMVRFKADPNNSNIFLLGNEDGTSFPLDAGDDTGWVSLSNLNRLWYSNASGTMDYLYWWLQV